MLADAIEPFFRELTQRSAAVIKPFFQHADLAVEKKKDETPVTVADRQAEKSLRDLIKKRYPKHGIIGEEYGEEDPEAEFVWVLDPIDGTISFTHGCPLFGTLICLLHEGNPIAGCIHQPILGKFLFGDGEKAALNGRPVKVRETTQLNQATLLTTDLKHIAQYQNQEAFDALAAEVKLFRTWGDCYGYFLVGAGFADIMVDPIVNPWDILPVIPIIRGAGGMITTWQGGDPVAGQSLVASNRFIHGRVIEKLKLAL